MNTAMLSNPEPPSAALSLRLSCDRCRTQKLKCSVPDGSNICQRCTKARVACIFGRRAPSKRTLRREQQTLRQSASPQLLRHSSIATPISPPPSTFGLAIATSSAASLTAASAPTLDVHVEGSTDSEQVSCYSQSIWDSPTLALQGLGPDMSECDGDGTYDWMDQGFAITDLQNCQTTSFDQTQFTQIALQEQTPESIDATSAILAAQQLTPLISDIQTQLTKLVDGPWNKADISNLEDYPVGSILELSRRFKTIVGQILGHNGSQNGESEESGSDDLGHGVTSQNATTDTPTMLLVMCGYLWLVRTYGVVLGHFQKYLNRMLPNQRFDVSAESSGSAISLASSALRLGELPCSNATLSLQQIHIAMRMLLDVLHEIEGHLGRGAVVARDMAVTLLVNSGRCPNDSVRGLGKKATTVKELLRERMGL